MIYSSLVKSNKKIFLCSLFFGILSVVFVVNIGVGYKLKITAKLDHSNKTHFHGDQGIEFLPELVKKLHINILNKENILISNSQLTTLLVRLFFPTRKFVYVTHGYANGFDNVPLLRKCLAQFIFKCPWSKCIFIGCGEDELDSIVRLRKTKKRSYWYIF